MDRALTNCAKVPWFETHFEIRFAISLTVHRAMNGDLVGTLARRFFNTFLTVVS